MTEPAPWAPAAAPPALPLDLSLSAPKPHFELLAQHSDYCKYLPAAYHSQHYRDIEYILAQGYAPALADDQQEYYKKRAACHSDKKLFPLNELASPNAEVPKRFKKKIDYFKEKMGPDAARAPTASYLTGTMDYVEHWMGYYSTVQQEHPAPPARPAEPPRLPPPRHPARRIDFSIDAILGTSKK